MRTTNSLINDTAIIFLMLLSSRIREIIIARSIREHEKIQQWELLQ